MLGPIKVLFNCSFGMPMASGEFRYSELLVFWLKFIPSVCMLLGGDVFQGSSLYDFGLEVIHYDVWLVYGPIRFMVCTSFNLNSSHAIPSPCQRKILSEVIT